MNAHRPGDTKSIGSHQSTHRKKLQQYLDDNTDVHVAYKNYQRQAICKRIAPVYVARADKLNKRPSAIHANTNNSNNNSPFISPQSGGGRGMNSTSGNGNGAVSFLGMMTNDSFTPSDDHGEKQVFDVPTPHPHCSHDI